MMSDKNYSSVDLAVAINSSLETMALYREFTEERKWTYVQDRGGPLVTVCKVENKPVCVAPLIHRINGFNILYVEATSGMVDWDMIERWVKDRIPAGVKFLQDPVNLGGEIASLRKPQATLQFEADKSIGRIQHCMSLFQIFYKDREVDADKSKIKIHSTVDGFALKLGDRNVTLLFKNPDELTMVFRSSYGESGIRHSLPYVKMDPVAINLAMNWLINETYSAEEF